MFSGIGRPGSFLRERKSGRFACFQASVAQALLPEVKSIFVCKFSLSVKDVRAGLFNQCGLCPNQSIFTIVPAQTNRNVKRLHIYSYRDI